MKVDGERMKALRHERMLTQEEVAKLAGLTQDTVVAAERGRSVSPKTARKITEALGAEPADLLPKADAPQQSGREAGEVVDFGTAEFNRIARDPKALAEALATIASTDERLEEYEAEIRAKRQGRSA